MDAFATVADLAAGWRALSPEEAQVANTLLERAAAQIASLLAQHGMTVDPADEVQEANLVAVNCNMVRRAMEARAGDGVASASQGIGSTSVSLTFSNPDGSLYLTKADRDALGLSSAQAMWSIGPAVGEE